jgi:hypothetical protein
MAFAHVADFVAQNAGKLLRALGLLDDAVEEQHLPARQRDSIDHADVCDPGANPGVVRIDLGQQLCECSVACGGMAQPSAKIADHRFADPTLPAFGHARAEPVGRGQEQREGRSTGEGKNRGRSAKAQSIDPCAVFDACRKVAGEAGRKLDRQDQAKAFIRSAAIHQPIAPRLAEAQLRHGHLDP